MASARFGSEVSEHLRGVRGLEKQLALQQFGEQQNRECRPRLDEDDENREEGEGDAATKDEIRWAELEAEAGT